MRKEAWHGGNLAPIASVTPAWPAAAATVVAVVLGASTMRGSGPAQPAVLHLASVFAGRLACRPPLRPA